MKKLLPALFVLLCLTVAAGTYNSTFNAWLVDGNVKAADSILKIWEKEAPGDPELYPARFNLLLNKARQSHLILSSGSEPTGEYIAFSDSSGETAGYISGGEVWDDSLVELALAEISRGIEACPDRLDFRLGKSAAAIMTGNWALAADDFIDLLDRDNAADCRWLTSDGDTVENADAVIADVVFSRMRDFFMENDSVCLLAMPFARRAAGRFPDDIKIVNMTGGMNVVAGDTVAAVSLFEHACRLDSTDATPMLNLAYIWKEQGDTAKALQIYDKVVAGDFDDDSRSAARDMTAKLRVRQLRPYEYFFNYLPMLALQVHEPGVFANVRLCNSIVPADNGWKTPFDDSQIEVETIRTPEGVDVIVWTFPMPDEIPNCRYMAFMADGEGACKAYTFEMSIEKRWVVGQMYKDGTTMHSNYGDYEYAKDAAAFVELLRKKKLLEP